MSEFSLAKVLRLLEKAKGYGVSVSFAENELSIHVEKGKQIDRVLLEELKENKPFLIQYFKNFAAKEKAVPLSHQLKKFDRHELKKIPLSFAQERLWFIDQLEGSLQYHLPTVLHLTGKINFDALNFSLQNIINRHEVLRTVIKEEDGRGFQYINDTDRFSINLVDGTQYLNDAGALQLFIKDLIRQPFDLSKDHMVRADLVALAEEEHVLVVTMHHIASDAWSTPLLVAEVAESYSAFTENRVPNLLPLDIQYADYAVWQRNYLQGDVLDTKVNYWKEKLEGLTPIPLPTDYVRPTIQTSKGANSTFKIDKALAEQLQKLSQQQGSTLYMTLLSAFKVLLYRYSGQQDICVGTSIASREQQALEGLIGFFVNTLVLRDEVNGAAPFTDLLQQVKTTTLQAYEHQDVPFERVVEAVMKERDPSRNPLFQVMLVLGNTPETAALRLGDLQLSKDPYDANISKFDLTFFINETSDGLQGKVEYSTDLFSAATIRKMTAHFEVLLGSVVKEPQQKIGSLPMLTSAEEQQILVQFNDSEVAYPTDKSIVDLFEEQSSKTPDNNAVIFENEILTYRQLNERSNQLAHYLKSRGVKPGALVPLYIERSAEMMIGIIGIMKAGAAYVPIDTDFPKERIQYMLDDTGAGLIVSSSNSSGKLHVETGVEIVETDNVSNQSTNNLPEKVLPGQLAYVIYTSGSTGKPKGVMIEHRSLVDYYFGLNKNIQTDQCRSFALVSTIATDLGNTVIYAALLSGGTLHLFSKESVSNIEYLHQYFSEQKIDCLKIVPSHWKALCTEESLLMPEKLLVFGGEALQTELVEGVRLSGTTCRVINHYGPTETTIGKLLHEVKQANNYGRTIPIGKPFSNTKVYILSKEMQPAPIGIPGQLYIAGDGVARGYFNNEELSKEKFITDPFCREGISKMYGTGDLVKWLEDGNIAFIGRVDDQVKIRGYRIELGEIETVLQQCGLVSQAVVLAREDKQGNKRLVAYIVPKDAFDREDILIYLKDQLPDYMIPAVLMELENLPLTANGKVDRKSLPDPDAEELLSGRYVAPRNETETKMSAIWEDVLEVDQVGVHDDFFELGGHSLLAVRLVSAIRKGFVVEMPIGDIFDYPTVALLSEQVAKHTGTTVLPSIEIMQPRPAHIPLSFSQERLWFIDRLEGSIQYHVPAALRLKGKLNINTLSYALQTIVDRHEVLRSVIRAEEGKAYQYVKDAGDWKLSVVDGSSYNADSKSLQQYLQQLVREPFDLAKDDMFRATLITLGEEEYILLATLHHIASDGWSRSILVKEVVELYNAHEEGRPAQLPVLKVQYADFALWQRTNLNGEVIEKKLGYWKKKLEAVAALQLPADFKRPAVWSTRGASSEFTIDKDLTLRLLELSQKQGTTLFMTLLAAFKVMLHRHSGQQDICVGTPIAGRQQIEVEDLIGFFVNTLALRSEVDSDNTFTELLQQVRATTLEGYEHQEVPFEKVVDSLVLERDLSRNPLFQVMFVLRNTPEIPELKLGEVVLSGQGFEHTSTLFDITLFVTETEQGLHCHVEYSTSIYAAPTILRMMAHFKELLHSVVSNPENKIGVLPMISAEEKHQLLVEFNHAGTGKSNPADKNIITLFEEQVEKTPGAVAVIFEKDQITYRELNERANQVAHYLRSKGVKEETLIPIIMDRSIDMIAGIWGILKAGGVYIPMDPEYPLARINYMLDDTNADFILSSHHTFSKITPRKQVTVIKLDTDWPVISQQPAVNPAVTIESNQLAYLIYTSGSTGKPKGVMLQHCNLSAFISWCREEFSASRFDMVYASTSICFDISLFEIFYTLSIGKPLRVIENGLHIGRYLPGDSMVLINTVPVVIENLLNEGTDLSNVSVINMAGEPVPWKVQQSLDTETIETRNLYGPTEDTVYSTVYRLRRGSPILIGRPISNSQVYIINKDQQLCPVNVAGEICIGGAGLARGYLNMPGLTAEKFIANPFSNNPQDRIYKTGDLGRWMPDGNIDYMGRIDDQVKIRGHRIELGEIEIGLQQSGLVQQAAVLVKKDKENHSRLVSYYIPNWDAVKIKERELYERQVEIWKEVYETEYAKTEENYKDEEFNIDIWNNSFTGKPIEEEQMHEWLQDIVNLILVEEPGNLLEIGCGTGLIYYQLTGKVKKYIGTDFSSSSINQIRHRISKGLRDYGPTELKVCAAHEVTVEEGEKINTVLLNSIVQYFPGEDYLSSVIKNSISVLNGNGRIIIGDVRDNRLLELFKYRLQAQKLQSSVNIKELRWAVEQEVLKEEELCFSPEYFYHLKLVYPEITHVDIQWKKTDFLNELTLYRYNVVIYVGIQRETIEPNWQNWNGFADKQIIKERLQKASNTVVAIKDVPNFRLWKERLVDYSVKNQSVQSVGELMLTLEKEDQDTIEIRDILNTAKANGFSCRIMLDNDPLKMNLLMERNPSDHFVKQVFTNKNYSKNNLYSNIPMFTNISSLLQKEIRSILQVSLPEYMIPSELIALPQMPLTRNGKIDRRFLSEREDKAVLNKINYQPPVTEIQQKLVVIWQELLDIDQVGINDNFFELGGHSLLAMRVISAIRKELKVELAIKDLFQFTTIYELGKYLEIQLNIYTEESDSEEFDMVYI